MKKILIKIIEVYQHYLSPDHSIWAQAMDRTPYCRHIPSCSNYTKEAIEKKGALTGSYMGFKRILRCMPWNKPSYDPVEKD